MPPDPDNPENAIMDTEASAAAVHVAPDVIRQWARRRLITPLPGTERSPRYRLSDVQDAEYATRRQRRWLHLLDEARARLGM